MKILIVHNAYQQRGGEDAVVDAETTLLRSYGHDVQIYKRHNDELNHMSMVMAAVSAVWSNDSANEMELLCEEFHPDLIHAHNTFPLISPSFAWMAARNDIPVVQTLHNFRLLCPQAMFLREGRICEDCLGKTPWRAVKHKCYRGSMLQSAVAAGMLTAHRALGTWRERVTHYIALNQFCRDKFVEGGLPADRLRIKPHFVVSCRPPVSEGRSGGLFVGRLAEEKGLHVLAAAISRLPAPTIRVAGSGPLEHMVQQTFRGNYLGQKSREEVLELLHGAMFMVAPSTCYETFALTVVEAFSCGTPVIASRHGAFSETIKDGITGLLFEPGDANDLARKIAWANAHPQQMLQMGRAARLEYEAEYTPQRNYKMLMGIYEDAIGAAYAQRQVA